MTSKRAVFFVDYNDQQSYWPRDSGQTWLVKVEKTSLPDLWKAFPPTRVVASAHTKSSTDIMTRATMSVERDRSILYSLVNLKQSCLRRGTPSWAHQIGGTKGHETSLCNWPCCKHYTDVYGSRGTRYAFVLWYTNQGTYFQYLWRKTSDPLLGAFIFLCCFCLLSFLVYIVIDRYTLVKFIKYDK